MSAIFCYEALSLEIHSLCMCRGHDEVLVALGDERGHTLATILVNDLALLTLNFDFDVGKLEENSVNPIAFRYRIA